MGRADFFLATNDEIATVLRGWKRPAPLLAEPITITVVNPFTKESKEIRSWIKDDLPTADADAVTTVDLRGLPSIDQRGILTTDVVDLSSIVMQWDLERADSEVHGRLQEGPPHATAAVCEIPPALVGRLARLSAKELGQHGRDWAARARDESVAIAGEPIPSCQAARLEIECAARLSALAGLAKRAVVEGRGMFLCLSF